MMGEGLHDGMSAPIKGTPQSSLIPSPVGDTTQRWLSTAQSREPDQVGTLVLDFWPRGL